jgi:hypothetical protein
MAKDAKKNTKASKKGKGAAPASAGTDPAVIRYWTSRGRAWGSLIGFAVVTWVSYRAGMGLTDAAFRGIIGGMVFSLVGWGCTLLVLTGLLRTAAQSLIDEERKVAEAAAVARAEAMAQTAAELHPRHRTPPPPDDLSDLTGPDLSGAA